MPPADALPPDPLLPDARGLDAPSPVAGRPRIVLHIGRNKAGSTTLQDVCLHNRAALLDQGVDYVLFGHLAHSRADTPGFPTFEALRDHAMAHPDRRVLVSNEFMFGWPDAFTEAAARVLADCEVRVLAYIRPYDAWIVSAYAEETRKGMNQRDIDAYAAWMAPRTSAWPYLAKWGESFGWPAMRVRTLDRRALHGGELIADFSHALGVDPLDGGWRRSNASPHWLELELARRLTERNGEVEWAGVAHAELEPLLGELRLLLGGVAPAPYLDAAHRGRLLELYAADLARIGEASGQSLPGASLPGASLPGAPASAGPHRTAAPRFDQAPRDLLQAFFARVTEDGFAARHPQAARRARRLADELGHLAST